MISLVSNTLLQVSISHSDGLQDNIQLSSLLFPPLHNTMTMPASLVILIHKSSAMNFFGTTLGSTLSFALVVL